MGGIIQDESWQCKIFCSGYRENYVLAAEARLCWNPICANWIGARQNNKEDMRTRVKPWLVLTVCLIALGAVLLITI